MKNIYKLRFMFATLVVLLMGTTGLQATDDYYLISIGSVDLTSGNANGTLSRTNFPAIKSGTVSYNPTSNTLTLNNATIECDINNISAVKCQNKNLTISVIGTSSIKQKSFGYGLEILEFTTIKGEKLICEGNYSGVVITSDTLTLSGINLVARGGFSGLEGDPLEFQKRGLFIKDKAVLSASALDPNIDTYNGSVMNIEVFSLAPEHVVFEPVGAVYNSKAEGICDANGNLIRGQVKVGYPTYDLWIAGEQVRANNVNNLSLIPGVTGSANYNPANKTLTLNTATIQAGSNKHPIRSEIDNLKILVTGNNTIKTESNAAAIRLEKNTSIEGSGTLNVDALATNATTAISINASLDIKNCTLNASGKQSGIVGNNSTKLNIDKATVTAIGSSGSIYKISELNLTLSSIIQPAGAVFNSSKKAICDANANIITTKVEITVPKYDLKLCGTQVTAANKDDLSVINGVTGTVTYNPDTKTLLLKNATLTMTGSINTIRSATEGLTIKVVGNNTVKSNGWSTIQFDEKSGTIDGSGTLTVSNSAYDHAIYVKNTTLTIKNCSLNVIGGKRGITGTGNSGTLAFNNATVTVKGNEASITHFNQINLNDCEIAEPSGAKVSRGAETFYSVRDAAAALVNTTVKIKPTKDLLICGVRVTETNKDNLSIIPGVKGKLSYDYNTKTLTLDGAELSTTGNIACIYTKIDGITIELIGTNKLTGNGWSPFSSDGDNSCTIKGSGSLEINNPHADNSGIFVRNGSLTIKDCTIKAYGGKYGIYGNMKENSLNFDNATVSATGPNAGSIVGFKEINFNNCTITDPYSSMFEPAGKAICYSYGGIIKEEVKINPSYGLSVCHQIVTSLNKDNIESFYGVKGGKINYNPETKTLRLENATIDVKSSEGIDSEVEGLTIELVGNNSITTEYLASIMSFNSLTIKGTGSLTVNNTTYFAIWSIGTPLTIKECTVNVSGSVGLNGFANGGFINDTAILTIDNANVTATGTSGSIIGYKNIILKNSTITQPADAVFNPNKHAICSPDGNIIKTEIRIVGESTDVEELTSQPVIIYPNPVQDILHIQTEETVKSVSIYNLQGKTVTEVTGFVSEINITHLPAGIYMVRMVIGESVSTTRIIKK